MGEDVGSGAKQRAIPTTGMRGGLGRTLLTAFLLLAVVPLALIGGYAAHQNRKNLQSASATKLMAVARLRADSLSHWIETLHLFAALAPEPGGDSWQRQLGSWWSASARPSINLAGAAFVDARRRVIWDTGECSQVVAQSWEGLLVPGEVATRFLSEPEVVTVVEPRGDGWVVICADGLAVQDILDVSSVSEETMRLMLVIQGKTWPEGEQVAMPGIGQVWPEDDLQATYERAGRLMVGVYAPVPELGGGIIAEQPQDEVAVATEQMVAMLIAFVLAVALTTTATAAIVIRQITRPVIQLTESALKMADGDLDQRLPVRSRDEIGILTHVFNEMAADLKALYTDLEGKVAERTQRLQEANYQIQRRALHLQASQDVSRAVTSIRDPEELLAQVTELIRNYFVYATVAVYLVKAGGSEARLQAFSPHSSLPDRGGETGSSGWPESCHPGDGTIIGSAIRHEVTQVSSEPLPDPEGWYQRTINRMAVPLKMEGRLVGVLGAVKTSHERIQRDELEVLEALAAQVAVALENARAYERERLAALRLEQAETFKAQFLANMTRELMGPLNTIIGFSRLLLKGIDGALTPQQLEDIAQIHQGSQYLYYLITDILSISEIQAGTMELRLQPVDVRELVDGVVPTATALIQDKPLILRCAVPEDLPLVWADPARLRQVLVNLLSNAAKFTEEGEIEIRAWEGEKEVYLSVRDTGVGIPVEERERLFTYFEQGSRAPSRQGSGVGLGLALCRDFVTMHGGRIWVDSEVGVGSTFTFTIPVHAPSRDTVRRVSEAAIRPQTAQGRSERA